MTHPVRIGSLATSALVLCLLGGTASAQDSGWSFRFTPYLWVPTLSGSAEGAGGTPSFDFETDVLSQLEFGALAAFEASYNRWILIGDLMYMDVGSEAGTPAGILFDHVEADVSGLVFSGYGGYRVVDTERVDLDLLAGFRLFAIDLEAKLVPGAAPSTLTAGGSESWVNPLVGARLGFVITDRVFAGLAADFGAWDDDMTWQAIGQVGYRFNDTWDVRLGYRYLEAEHDFGFGTVDMAFQGPVIGLGISF